MKTNPFLSVLSVANFRKIWTSQVLSQVTLNLINFVIVLRIFEATHSTVAVSMVWLFYAIPTLLLGPFSGTLVDLAQKRKVLIFAALSEAVIVLFYLLVKEKIWPIYSVIFLYSLVNQLYIPAEASLLITIVPRRLLPAANTFFLFTIYAAFLVGFGSAGSVIRLIGRDFPFLLGSLLLGLASLAVFLLPASLGGDNKKINGLTDFWQRVQEGYLFIRANREVLFPLILLVLSNVTVSILLILGPIFTTGVLLVELLDIGLVLVLPVGFGVLLGALGVVWALRHLRKKKVITFGLFLLATCLFFFSLILPKLPVWRLPVAMVIAFLLGVGMVSLFIPAQTSMQEKTPLNFRGRVFGVFSFLFTLVAILPILLTATIADTIGVTWVTFLLALILLGVAVYSLREPYLKQLRPEEIK